ncbi:iron-containing alcohol dehydrogenase [Sutterella sp.]|uniref:iron-containing alcohol dehydrogenase n=1 Tax=Sutterella sp. TaxID=1981025 RepID=UPI003FD8286C
MLNFSYCNPTRLVFGRDAELKVGETALGILGRPAKVLVLFGGGSARRTGILDAVEKSLEESGFCVIEMGGVQPNPRMGFVRETIDWVRDQGVKAVVAVGGGSVIDTAKAVAAGLEYEGDCWDFFEGRATVEKALPVFAVLTIPAAGSEQSIRAVITHHGTKAGIGSEAIRPKAAFINPARFSTLPAMQIGAGVTDMLSHILERYFTNTTATDYTDHQAEAAMRTIIAFGPKVLSDPSDYDAWCQIGLAGTFAHSGCFGLGREEDWACHAIEHEISGWNEHIVHGCGLAVVIPSWMRYVSHFAPKRFVDFAVRVMEVEPQVEDAATIALGIAKFTGWLQTLGMPTTMAALGAVDCPIEALARHCCRKGPVGHLKPLAADDVEAILTGAQ